MKPRTKPLKKTGMRRGRSQRSATSGGALFPKVKDAAFRRWLRTTHDCLIADAVMGRAVSPNDRALGLAVFGFVHSCWGAMTPAHVGKHQAQGAPDVGACVPLCQAAHRYYDEHRQSWAKVTGYTEERMQAAADEYADAWHELVGGAAPEQPA